MTIPLVLILLILAFGLVKWGKQKVTGIFVGVLLGIALASTAVGPPLLHGISSASAAIVNALSGAIS